jgi:hypothetical protein
MLWKTPTLIIARSSTDTLDLIVIYTIAIYKPGVTEVVSVETEALDLIILCTVTIDKPRDTEVVSMETEALDLIVIYTVTILRYILQLNLVLQSPLTQTL